MSAGMDQETGNVDFATFIDGWFARHSPRPKQPQMELPWFDVAEIWPLPQKSRARSREPLFADSPSLRLFDDDAKGEGKAKICAGLCNTPQVVSDLTTPGGCPADR